MVRDTLIPGRAKTVIVVDGDTSLRNSLRFSLTAEGFSVTTYKNGHELLAGNDFPTDACLVIDHDLPDMAGLDVVRRLRDRAVTLPAILIANHPNAPLRRRAEEVGVSMIEKPLIGDSLLQGILAALTPA